MVILAITLMLHTRFQEIIQPAKLKLKTFAHRLAISFTIILFCFYTFSYIDSASIFLSVSSVSSRLTNIAANDMISFFLSTESRPTA